ncbi:hypothetical protein Y032_0216g2386 [Ancylostoma ceylanicum]|uniref:Uncharacterized protein n=1 Tax=Ancylostoma ceylanicum TaxID=53326 RepID=A0A016SJ85_9BILA|nr:hypothetical protein Y032_0216g2386 [Ancylostoma ceylanicum]
MPEEDLQLLVLVSRRRTTRTSTTRDQWWNQPSGVTAQRRLISKIRAGVGTTVLHCAPGDPAARDRVGHGATMYVNPTGGRKLA